MSVQWCSCAQQCHTNRNTFLLTQGDVLETEVTSAHSILTCGDKGQVQLVVGALGAVWSQQEVSEDVEGAVSSSEGRENREGVREWEVLV